MIKKLVDFIVSSLEGLAVFAFIIILLFAFISGVNTQGLIGGLVALMLAFLFEVLVFGLLFLAIQNNALLKEIRDLLARK